MQTTVIGFIPPIIGVDSIFNTFRMGKRYAKLVEGEQVFLLDEKNKVLFGKAIVLGVNVGPVMDMCALHASENHTELGNSDGESSNRLYCLLQKIYGPHIVKPTRTATVVKLKRVECESTATSG